jgi:hypothetical protein
MRRFAFVELGPPAPEQWKVLLDRWVEVGTEERPGLPAMDAARVRRALDGLVTSTGRRALTRIRAIGPALVRDIVAHVRERRAAGDATPADRIIAQAVALYVLPQFDGLPRGSARDTDAALTALFGPDGEADLKDAFPELRDRFRGLYPTLDWDGA